MKKDYQRPEAELITFLVEERIMDEVVDGSMVVEESEFGS